MYSSSYINENRKKNGKDGDLRYRLYRNYMVLLFLLALFSVLGTDAIYEKSRYFGMQKQTLKDSEFRSSFFSEEMRNKEDYLSLECKTFLKNVEKEAVYFPIPESSVDKSLKISFADSWMSERTYKGFGVHEGTDIMASKNERGIYPVLSVSDGIVTNMGWLEKGGYRIGISSDSGTYYYYAHLESYADLREGDFVKAGQFLGYMGDSGYGQEGTIGKFHVHLHFGIYFYLDGGEISFNPYYLLCYLEKEKLIYSYS